jgi:hypothetical protein
MHEISTIIGTVFYGIYVRVGLKSPVSWLHQCPVGKGAGNNGPVQVQWLRAMAKDCAMGLSVLCPDLNSKQYAMITF